MRYFVIILSLIGTMIIAGISTSAIEAVPPLDSQFIYDISEVILVGRVTSVNSTFSPTHNLYQIEVEKYLKNQLDTDTVLAAGQNKVIIKLGNQVFKPGDRVLFFLNNDTINYDKYTGIFGVSYESKLVEPQRDQCNIFKKNIPAEHWIFGGRGPMPKISQQNNTDAENFVAGKKVLITYDIFNHTPDEKNIDVGIQIKNLDDPNSLYIYTEISPHLLKACTAYETLSWNFTPTKSGRYSVEFYDLRGSQLTMGFTVREQVVPKSQYWDSPLKQLHSAISADEIVCKNSLVLVQKKSGLPACVTTETREKLIQRNWAVDFPMKYIIDDRYWSTTHLKHHTTCAHIGVEKIPEEEAMHRFFWTMTDDDLEKIPIIKSMLEYNLHGMYSSDEYPITSTVVSDDVQNQYMQIFEKLAYGESWKAFLYDGKYYATVFSIC